MILFVERKLAAWQPREFMLNFLLRIITDEIIFMPVLLKLRVVRYTHTYLGTLCTEIGH